ncbi:hypothetical protein RJT34_31044 [Clitoria ternatea]|uniref:Uncharacterized protein n=1 Tax=Clitoria ternatea TaxID=43366 RepID=A0AAN9I384_CLITE
MVMLKKEAAVAWWFVCEGVEEVDEGLVREMVDDVVILASKVFIDKVSLLFRLDQKGFHGRSSKYTPGVKKWNTLCTSEGSMNKASHVISITIVVDVVINKVACSSPSSFLAIGSLLLISFISPSYLKHFKPKPLLPYKRSLRGPIELLAGGRLGREYGFLNPILLP